MNRRLFMFSGLASGLTLSFVNKSFALPVAPPPPECLLKVDEITAEATGFTRYQHFHNLSLPVSVLIAPPEAGFKIRTSILDQGSLDEAAFAQFIKETGIDPSLRYHSHLVSFTKEDLGRIASGEKEVKIGVLTPMGNFAHNFFFTAPPSALVKIKRGRQAKT